MHLYMAKPEFDLFTALDTHASELERLSWQGTFGQYINIIRARPNLARTSHQTLFDIVTASGTEPLPDGTKKYPFF